MAGYDFGWMWVKLGLDLTSGENWKGATQEALTRIAHLKDVQRSRGRVRHGDR